MDSAPPQPAMVAGSPLAAHPRRSGDKSAGRDVFAPNCEDPARTEALPDGRSSLLELLLRVVLSSTCGTGSPVMLTAHIAKPLRPGACDIQASMHHADGWQQRWLAEITQTGDLVGRAHVILDVELPSGSYVPWSHRQDLAVTTGDESIAPYLALARLCDAHDHQSSGIDGSPVWSTVSYFEDMTGAHLSSPLTVSTPRKKRVGALEHFEFDVLHEGRKVASVSTVYEAHHAQADVVSLD